MHISLAGVAIAVFAVFIAYFMGYANGVSMGRDEGFNDGKQKGAREGSIRAYAVGFDRGKRAREDDDDDDDGEGDDNEIGGSTNLGFAILAVAAGLFGVLWLTSHTPTTPIEYRGVPSLPAINANDITNLTRPDALNAGYPTTTGYPTNVGQSVGQTSLPAGRIPNVPHPQTQSRLQQTVTLPKVNRALPTATPMPSKGSTPVYYTPSEFEGGRREFPHPPPAFKRP